MASVAEKRPINRRFNPRTHREHCSGTEPITDQELSYWFRANHRASATRQAFATDILGEQFVHHPPSVAQHPSSNRSHSLECEIESPPELAHKRLADFRFRAPDTEMSVKMLTGTILGTAVSDCNLLVNLNADFGLSPISVSSVWVDAPTLREMTSYGTVTTSQCHTVLWDSAEPIGELPLRSPDNEWQSFYQRVDSFADLQDGWNSYSARRPSATAVANARDFLDVLCAAKEKPTRLNASAVGGVGVTFRSGVRKAYIEFPNAGTAHALFSDGVTEPVVREVPTGSLAYVRLIGDIRKYLND
jgi:hypothetical protein